MTTTAKPARQFPALTAARVFPAPRLTIPQVRRWARLGILAQSPAATLEWVEPLRRVTYPTGLVGIRGRVRVTAPGFAPAVMLVQHDYASTSCR